MSRHACRGEGCTRCQRLIDEREFGEPEPDFDEGAAENSYEAAMGW